MTAQSPAAIVPPSCPYPWTPDRGDRTYANPILCADYSDPDIIRDGDDFWLTASSFNCTPGLPILHSRDLVNWTIVNHAIKNNPDPRGVFDLPQHGCGVWAPAIRKHAGLFWIFFPLPDEGIYVTTAADPRDTWSEPWCLLAGKGYIDPCPLWDADGKAYLVHAYANSRCGIKHKLRVVEMSPDARTLIGEGKIIFDDPQRHPTCEGPKFNQRNGYYYVSAPAGGVALGWQLVLRSRNIFGPYKEKVVLAQRDTPINGPHQGALVELQVTSTVSMSDSPPLVGGAGGGGERQSTGQVQSERSSPHPNPLPEGEGTRLLNDTRVASSLIPQPSSLPHEWWFAHFQDAEMFGRIVHLQPVQWVDDWPLIGIDQDANGLGKPVLIHRKPTLPTQPIAMPQTSDDFATASIGLQWQWHANHRDDWHSLTRNPGSLWLRAANASAKFAEVPNLLLQKFSATRFTVETTITLESNSEHVDAGLIVMGLTHAAIAITHRDGRPMARMLVNDVETTAIPLKAATLTVRVHIDPTGLARFEIRDAQCVTRPIGEPFQTTPGRWIGAKVGVWCRDTSGNHTNDGAIVDHFRFT